MAKIDYNKHIWEGWTVRDFVEDLTQVFNQIMEGRSWHKPFASKEELKEWCKDNQPHYKKHIPGVYNHFLKLLNL